MFAATGAVNMMITEKTEKLENLPNHISVRMSGIAGLKKNQVRMEKAPDYRAHSCHKDYRQLKPWQRCPKDRAYVLDQL
jgi:hypothetical protein